MKLILENIKPPVGFTHAFDWICYQDGFEDGLHAYGATAQEALEQWQEYHSEQTQT